MNRVIVERNHEFEMYKEQVESRKSVNYFYLLYQIEESETIKRHGKKHEERNKEL